MYITPKQKRRYLFRILIIVIAIPLTVLVGYFATQYISDAGEEAVPQNVAISNLTTNSATITWTTSVASSGEVVVMSGDQESQPFIDFRGVRNRKTHYVEIIDLEPDTKYSFRIRSDRQDYFAEDGNDFTFRTFAVSTETPVPNPIYGKVSNSPENDSIVFVYTTSPTRSLPLSAVPTTTGNWIIDLSSLRTEGGGLLALSSTTMLKIVVIGQDGTGDSHTGEYSQIISSDGRLTDDIELRLVDFPGIIAELPENSVIISIKPVVSPPTPSDPTPSDPIPTDPTPTDPKPPEPQIPDDPDEGDFDDTERRFIVRSDVNWSDMVMGTSVGTTRPNVLTGDDSVILANLTDKSFAVAWLSDELEQGYITYGTSLSNLDQEARDVRDGLIERGEYRAHLVEVNSLQADTQYFFKIHSGSDVYDDSGQPFALATYSTLASPPPLDTVSGTVTGLRNYDDVVVLLRVIDEDGVGSTGTSNYAAEVTDSSGQWIMNIGDVRDSTGGEYFEYSNADILEVTLVAYADFTKKQYSISEKETADITIAVTTSSGKDPASTKIPLLDSYGVFSSLVDRLKDSNSGTPVTSVYPFFLLISSLTVLTVGALVFVNWLFVDKSKVN